MRSSLDFLESQEKMESLSSKMTDFAGATAPDKVYRIKVYEYMSGSRKKSRLVKIFLSYNKRLDDKCDIL